jgi:hypothetical protein
VLLARGLSTTAVAARLDFSDALARRRSDASLGG